MARYIYCPECDKNAGYNKNTYPGEFTNVVKGLSKLDCVCDFCDKTISIGDEACAVTMALGNFDKEKIGWTSVYVDAYKGNWS